MCKSIEGAEGLRYRLKELPPSDRPREKLLELGAENLTDSELLAILIRTGTSGKNAVDLARELLNHFGGIDNLSKASVEELSSFKGLGRAKAVTLKAAFEISKRVKVNRNRKITTPEEAYEAVKSFGYKEKEHFGILTLNRKGFLINVHVVSVGGTGSASVNPKEVFNPAVRDLAEAVILFHNHPSGDPTPSREDVEVTIKLAEAGRLLGIEVLDHIVIGNDRFVSLKGEGVV